MAWGYGAYLALVEIDAETGAMTVVNAHATSDSGQIVNPMLVEGQLIGGFAQGLGEAVMERVVIDADGQLLTGSFMDYAMPRAADIPPLSLEKMTTPSPMNSLGAKGVGEGRHNRRAHRHPQTPPMTRCAPWACRTCKCP